MARSINKKNLSGCKGGGVIPFNFPELSDRDLANEEKFDSTKTLLEMVEPWKDRGGLSNRRKKYRKRKARLKEQRPTPPSAECKNARTYEQHRRRFRPHRWNKKLRQCELQLGWLEKSSAKPQEQVENSSPTPMARRMPSG